MNDDLEFIHESDSNTRIEDNPKGGELVRLIHLSSSWTNHSSKRVVILVDYA